MKTSTAADYHERILRTLAHIQAHLDDALDLDGLARVACFSPYHFHRVFRGLVGEPVQEHVRRLRLERAAHRLKLQDNPVTDLAFEAPGRGRNQRGVERRLRVARGFHEGLGGRHVGEACRVGRSARPVRSGDPLHRRLLRRSADHAAGEAALRRRDHGEPPVQPEGEFGVMEIAGGEYATLMHKGPYETLGRAYQALLGGWLPQSGRELRDAPCFEAYLNSPQNTRPEELLTVIHAPV